MNTRRVQGFTLIELMLVVAVIAILAAIAFPAYRDYTAKSKIVNAVAGLAGEKIKVAKNYGAGKTGQDLCQSVATQGVTCVAGVLSVGATGAASLDTSIQLQPILPASAADRILWSCTVLAAAVPHFVGDDCDNLN